jgi:hypothetical protein
LVYLNRSKPFGAVKSVISNLIPICLESTLGTLAHHCLNRNHDEVLKQLSVMGERQQRDEYDLKIDPNQFATVLEYCTDGPLQLPFKR